MAKQIIACVCFIVAGVAALTAMMDGKPKSDSTPSSPTYSNSSAAENKPSFDPNGALAWSTTTFAHEASPDEERVTAEFPFQNTSDRSITITQVRASCGCLTRKLEQKTYASGESGLLQVEFQYGARTGKQSKAVTVHTDSHVKPTHTLRLMVEIPQPVRVWPKLVYWRSNEKQETKTVRVEFDHTSPVNINSVVPASDTVSTRIREVEKGRKYEIDLTPTEGGRPGQVPVTIKTDLPFKRLQNQVVYARVMKDGQPFGGTLSAAPVDSSRPVAPYSLEPESIQWSIGAKLESKTIRVLANGESASKITGVNSASGTFATELRTIKPGWEYELVVTPSDTKLPSVDLIEMSIAEDKQGSDPTPNSPLVAFAVVANES